MCLWYINKSDFDFKSLKNEGSEETSWTRGENKRLHNVYLPSLSKLLKVTRMSSYCERKPGYLERTQSPTEMSGVCVKEKNKEKKTVKVPECLPNVVFCNAAFMCAIMAMSNKQDVVNNIFTYLTEKHTLLEISQCLCKGRWAIMGAVSG